MAERIQTAQASPHVTTARWGSTAMVRPASCVAIPGSSTATKTHRHRAQPSTPAIRAVVLDSTTTIATTPPRAWRVLLASTRLAGSHRTARAHPVPQALPTRTRILPRRARRVRRASSLLRATRALAPHVRWECMRRTPRPTRARPALRAPLTPTLIRRRSALHARLGRTQRQIRRGRVYFALQGSLHPQLAAPASSYARPAQSVSTPPADPAVVAFALRARPTPTPIHRRPAWRAAAAHTLVAARRCARRASQDK
jgi:hypothetical protein